MKKTDMKNRWLAALLTAAVLSLSVLGCGAPADGGGSGQPSAAPSGSEPAAPAPEDEAPSATEKAFRMSQAPGVRNENFRKREEFAGFLEMAESCFLIPGLNEAMTPQGISYSEETGLAYISSYAITDTSSAISAVDPATGDFLGEYFLFQQDGSPFTSHVGGIAVAEGNAYLSAKLDNDGSYSVAVIPMEELSAPGSHDLTVTEFIPLPVSPSFLNYSEGVLWAGNFYHPKGEYGLSTGMDFTTPGADGDYGCYILGFRLEPGGRLAVPEGERYPVPDYVLVAPDRIQGVVMVGDTVYLSQSYGRTANSTILAYQIPHLGETALTVKVDGRDIPAHILDSACQTAAITAMPMTEGLCIGPEGAVLVLFESGSSRYRDGKYRTDRVWRMQG